MKNTLVALAFAFLASKSFAAPQAVDDVGILERDPEAAAVTAFNSDTRAGAVRLAAPNGKKWNTAVVRFVVPEFSPATAAKNTAWFGGAFTGIDVVDSKGQDSFNGVEGGVSFVASRSASGVVARHASPYIFYGSKSVVPKLAVSIGDDILITVTASSGTKATVDFENLTTGKSNTTSVNTSSNIAGNTVAWTFSSIGVVNVTQFPSFTLNQATAGYGSPTVGTGTEGAHGISLFRKNKAIVGSSLLSNTAVKLAYVGP